MVQILLMLEVLFTQDSKVDDLFCGASSGSEPIIISIIIYTKDMSYIGNAIEYNSVETIVLIKAVSVFPLFFHIFLQRKYAAVQIHV